MNNLRTYGVPPFKVAVLHGGPGAPGQMAPVARRLSSRRGVLEPLQTKHSIDGQVEELRLILEANSLIPVTLIGFSWGAMLGFIFTAKHQIYVNKLILVGSGVYDNNSVEEIQEKRLSRLEEGERQEALRLIMALSSPAARDKNRLLGRLGKLLTKADTFDPLTLETEVLDIQYDIFSSVWKEVVDLRERGIFLKLGNDIECPVVAIHGDYDPHPAEAINRSLLSVLRDFKFVLLKNCGHVPWIEKEAQKIFYEVLERELLE